MNNYQTSIKRHIYGHFRIVKAWLIMMLCMVSIPVCANDAAQVPSKLEFFLYPPNGNPPAGTEIGQFWYVMVKDSERNNLPANFEIPSRYIGLDEYGDRDENDKYYDLPVYVVWNFAGCNFSSVSIPNSIKQIGDNSFVNCTNLKSIVIPKNVQEVGTFAFKGCTSLSSVVVSPGNKVRSSFSGCDIKKGAYPTGNRAFVADIEVAYPNNCIPNSDGLIYNPDATAFYFAPWNVKSLELPATVNTIGPKALAGCTQLNELIMNSTIPPAVSGDSFSGAAIGTIQVPYGTRQAYINAPGWSDFASKIIEHVIEPQSITLNTSSATLKVSESIKLIPTIEPEDTSIKDVTWTSSNPRVATVDQEGNVTAVAIGTTTITATCGPISATCAINVIEGAIKATEIILSQKTANLSENETLQLTATVLPDNATYKTVTWSSDTEGVATVDANGLVRALTPGKAAIKAKCGEIMAECNITVEDTFVESITFDKPSISLEEDKMTYLKAIITPTPTSNARIKWESESNHVWLINVDVPEKNNCLIRVLIKGYEDNSGTGIVKASLGGKTAECKVNFTKKPRDGFLYEYEGQTLRYPVINEALKTCKAEQYRHSSYEPQGHLIIPPVIKTKYYGEYTVKAIDTNGFSGCKNLTSVEIPNSVTEIGPEAFMYVPFTSVSIPNSVTEICYSAFGDCKLSSVTIPSSVTHIGDFAFYGNETLKKIIIEDGTGPLNFDSDVFPDDAESLYLYLGRNFTVTPCCIKPFKDKTSLNELIIGNNVTAIGSQDFAGCTALTKIESKAIIPPSISADTFDEATYQTAELHVPEPAVEAYKNHEIWGKFNVLASSISVTSITLDPTEYSGKSGDEFQIKASVLPENASVKDLRWSSSDEKIAVVDQTGKVSLLNEGECTVTASANDDSEVEASCKVICDLWTNIDVIDYNYKEPIKFYNLSGILLDGDASAQTVERLLPGVYIVRQGVNVKMVQVK